MTLRDKKSEALFQFAQYDAAAAEKSGYSNYSYWRSTLSVFLHNRAAVALLIVLALLLLFTFVQPYLPGQYDANVINNHPETGRQLSNLPPSLTTVKVTVPEGTLLYGAPYDENWYYVTNVMGSIDRRQNMTITEYGEEFCRIEFEDISGWVLTEYLRLPDDPQNVPYEAMSNYKVDVYMEPVDVTNDGNSLYVSADSVRAVEGEEGMVETVGEADLRILPSTHAFWFGTNNIGQDLWSRVWSGTRTSLFIGFAVALTEALVGIFMGVIWGYVRKLDRLMTEIYNVLDNIPTTIVLILIAYILHPSVPTLIFAMCLTGWLGMSRFVRNQIVIIRDRDYNLASRCLGTGTFRIIFRNLLPYLVSVIMLRMALAIPGAIGNEVFLTYIGLGIPVSIPSLGNLVNEGRQLITSPSLRYQLIFPAIVLSVVTISFYIIGNAFADAADPKNHV